MSFLRTGCSLAANFASSSSSALRPPSTALFHTSTFRLAESQKQRAARLIRQANIEKSSVRARERAANKPHVVLGTRPGDKAKWEKCDLKQVLVTEKELEGLAPLPEPSVSVEEMKNIDVGSVQVPKYMSYGLDGLDGDKSSPEQSKFFFETLPLASTLAEAPPTVAEKLVQLQGNAEHLSTEENHRLAAVQVKEEVKARQLARVVDLRNANARGIAFENRRRIIAAFSPKKDASDSGYPEVQVALLTMKIRNIWDHLMESKKDIHSRRALRILVHQRSKQLKYIKRLDRDRYDRVLERCALEPEAVEGELVL